MSRPTLSLLALLGALLTFAVPAEAATIATGATTTCAVRNAGSVACWGEGTGGVLGNGSTASTSAPVWVPGIKTATSVSVGSTAACARLSDGSVDCWGEIGANGSGLPSSDKLPHPVAGVSGATAIASGYAHSCAIVAGGAIKCWGRGLTGQLGNGLLTPDDAPNALTPVSVTGVTGATQISAGDGTTCAVMASGDVKCWGDSSNGLMGLPFQDPPEIATPTDVPGIHDAQNISVGLDHVCVLRTGGKVSYWGNGYDGQLGNGTSGILGYSDSPVTVPITDAIAVTTGAAYSCAARTGGVVSCWGDTAFGQLGAATSDKPSPTVVSGVSGVTEIAGGGNRTCVSTAAAVISCWGSDSKGELGSGRNGYSASAVPVSATTGALSVSAGSIDSCAVQPGGSIKCWGFADFGVLGDAIQGSFDFDHKTDASVPVTIPNVSGATAVSTGALYSCALTASAVRCWGYNGSGQLGVSTGIANGEALPTVSVAGLSTATSISAGLEFACAVLSDATVKCWGDRSFGQLGTGVFSSGSPTPTMIDGVTGATAVAAGGDHACARLSDGTVKCWGDDALGQLGDGAADSSGSVVTVAGLSDAISVSSNGSHSCAVRADHTVVCWGTADFGALGGGVNQADAPSAVPGISDATTVSTGDAHTCALRTGGSVSCWGNAFGTDGNASIPVQPVAGITDATSLSAGGGHTCALRTGGGVSCWGLGLNGQLGDGDFPTGHHPLQRTAAAVAFSTDPNQTVNPGPGPGPNPDPGTNPGTPTTQPPVVKPDTPKATTPAVPAGPTGTLWFHSGTLGMRGFLIKPTKAGKCPKRATVVTTGGTAATKKLRLGKTVKSVLTPKKLCALTGTIKLPGKLAKASRIVVTVSGTGIKRKARALKPV